MTPQGCGWPCKVHTKPIYSDFPVSTTQEDQERWFKMKTTQRWMFNKLTSDYVEEYREKCLDQGVLSYKNAKEKVLKLEKLWKGSTTWMTLTAKRTENWNRVVKGIN